MKIVKDGHSIICFYIQNNDTPNKEILTIDHGKWRILYAGDHINK